MRKCLLGFVLLLVLMILVGCAGSSRVRVRPAGKMGPRRRRVCRKQKENRYEKVFVRISGISDDGDDGAGDAADGGVC